MPNMLENKEHQEDNPARTKKNPRIWADLRKGRT